MQAVRQFDANVAQASSNHTEQIFGLAPSGQPAALEPAVFLNAQRSRCAVCHTGKATCSSLRTHLQQLGDEVGEGGGAGGGVPGRAGQQQARHRAGHREGCVSLGPQPQPALVRDQRRRLGERRWRVLHSHRAG